MSKSRKKSNYLVYVGTRMVRVFGVGTPGAAARQAFRRLIKDGYIKRQPKSYDNGAFWEGASIVHEKNAPHGT